jgi:hypothetical protein
MSRALPSHAQKGENSTLHEPLARSSLLKINDLLAQIQFGTALAYIPGEMARAANRVRSNRVKAANSQRIEHPGEK